MGSKPFWTSKVLWVNAVALLAIVLQSAFGWVLDAEAQAGIIAVINLILRLVTKQELSWGKGVQILLVGLLLSWGVGCGHVRVCNETLISLENASAPSGLKIGIDCDGTRVVEIDTQEVVTPGGTRIRGEK
jgi:hypothetical protein